LSAMSSTTSEMQPVPLEAIHMRRSGCVIQYDERTAMRKGLSTSEGSAIIGVGVVAFGSIRFTTGHLHFFMPHGEHAHHAHHGHTSHQESNGQETGPAESVRDADRFSHRHRPALTLAA